MTSNEILSLGIFFVTLAAGITCLLNFATLMLMKSRLRANYKELAHLKERENENLAYVTNRLDEIEKVKDTFNEKENELIDMKNSLEELKTSILDNLKDINELEKEIECKLKKI